MTSNVFPAIIKATYDPTGGFPKMVQDAQRASSQIRKQFESDLTSIKQLGETALSIPRNAGGSLDLGVAEYRRAADAAKAHATALREIANAAASAAKSSGDTSRSTQTYVQAARAAAREAEQQAVSVNNTAIAHERLQAELNKTKSATDAVVSAQNRGTTAYRQSGESLRGMRQATIQSAQQIQDLGISLYSGQRASTVFAQQLPQLAFALTSLEGNTNKTLNRIGAFAAFLSGPLWSVALVGASIGLGVLADKYIFAADSSDKLKDKSLSLREALDLVNVGTEQATKAIREYNDAQAAARQSSALEKDELIKKADAYAIETIRIRENIVARIEALQLADRELRKSGDRGAFGFGAGANALGGDLAKAKKDVADAQQALRNLKIERAEIGAKNANDPIAKINDQYDRMADAAKKAARENDGLTASLQKTLTVIEGRRKAALDAAKETSRSVNGSTTVTPSEVSRILTKAFGGTITSTTGGRHTQGSDHYRGQAVDFVPRGGVNAVSKQEIRDELAKYGIEIRFSRKGEQLLGPGDKDHANHFHVGYERTRRNPEELGEKRQRILEAEQRKAEALQNNLDQISTSVTRISSEFDRQPRFIDRATLASEKLRQVIADIDKNLASGELNDEQRAKKIEERAAAVKTLEVEIPRAVRQPFDDITKQSERELELQNLRLAGREVEAQLLQSQYDLMQRYGAETEEELATALAKAGITKQEYLTQLEIQKVLLTNRNIEQERLALLGQTIEDRISRLRELRESAISTIADAAATGNVSFKNIFDTINRQFADQFARKFFDQFLGGAFQSEEDRLRNLKNQADGQLVVSTTRVADAMDRLDAKINGVVTGVPANDNPASNAASIREEAAIIVSGVRNGNRDFARLITKLLEALLGADSVLAADIGSAIVGALEGAQIGGFIGSAFGSGGGKIGRGLGGLLGGVNSILGPSSPLSGVFAALPQVGAFIQANSAISSLLGNDQVKNGKTLGVISPFLTAIFGSALRGSATIGGVNGSLGITGTRGNSKSRIKSSTDAANSVIDQINAIAEQLGGGLNASAGAASIGIRKKKYVLDPTGRGRTKGAGTINFGSGEEAAIAAARALALDLINDGVITGLRAGSQKLLANAKSLEAGLEKALKFQSVFDRLEAIKNPMGAAIGTLNKEFTGLIAIFKEAGASAEEFAQLEELYGLERQKVIEEQSQALTGSLRQLIEDLKQGENGLALRDRLANIRSQFNPLAETIRAGGTVDYDRFSELARQLIDVQRQISGSQVDYFAVFNEILGLSEQALAGQRNVISIGSGATSPFSGSSAPSNASTPVVGAINSQTSTLVASLAAVQAQIANLNFAPSRLSTANGFSLGGSTYF